MEPCLPRQLSHHRLLIPLSHGSAQRLSISLYVEVYLGLVSEKRL